MLKLNSLIARRLGSPQQYFACFTLAFALTGGPVSAETITSVSCVTPTAPFASNGSSCNAVGSYGYSRAAVSSSIALPASASDVAFIDISSTASALQYGVRGISATATAQAKADIGITFDTTGSLRNGLLELSFVQNAWQLPLNGYITESISVGSYTAALTGGSLTDIWIPIQLGADFGFDYATSLTAIGSSGSGITNGSLDSRISLQAFESDGTTGVQLFDPPANPSPLLTPEPASIGMMTVGMLSLALLVRHRR